MIIEATLPFEQLPVHLKKSIIQDATIANFSPPQTLIIGTENGLFRYYRILDF